MRVSVIMVLLMFLVKTNLFVLNAQSFSDFHSLFDDGYSALPDFPDKAIKIANFINNNSPEDNVIAEASVLKAYAYFYQNDYVKTLEEINHGIVLSKEKHLPINDQFYIVFAKTLTQLQLYKTADFYLSQVDSTMYTTEFLVQRFFYYEALTQLNIEIRNVDASKQFMQKAEKIMDEQNLLSFQPLLMQKKIQLWQTNEQKDSIKQLTQISNDSLKLMSPQKRDLLILAAYYLGDYDYIIHLHEQNNPFVNYQLDPDVYKSISLGYLMNKNIKLFTEYDNIYRISLDSLSKVNHQASLLAVSLSKKISDIHIFAEESNHPIRISYIIILLILCFSIAFVYWSYFNKNNFELNAETLDNKTINQFVIPDTTEELISQKLIEFEEKKMFLKRELTLTMLAKLLDTNTKYLSEIINKNFKKNFNRYINELRVNYLVELLQSDEKVLNYKIAYLSELCGFNSRNVFATAFKSVVGESPSVFIEKLRKKRRL